MTPDDRTVEGAAAPGAAVDDAAATGGPDTTGGAQGAPAEAGGDGEAAYHRALDAYMNGDLQGVVQLVDGVLETAPAAGLKGRLEKLRRRATARLEREVPADAVTDEPPAATDGPESAGEAPAPEPTADAPETADAATDDGAKAEDVAKADDSQADAAPATTDETTSLDDATTEPSTAQADEAKTEDVKADEAKTEDVKADDAKADEAKTEDVKAADDEATPETRSDAADASGETKAVQAEARPAQQPRPKDERPAPAPAKRPAGPAPTAAAARPGPARPAGAPAPAAPTPGRAPATATGKPPMPRRPGSGVMPAMTSAGVPVSPPAAGLKGELDRVTAELDRLRKAVGGVEVHIVKVAEAYSKLAKDGKRKDQAYDQLYEELRQYKDNFLKAAQKPLFLDVILLYDGIMRTLATFAELKDEQVTRQMVVDALTHTRDEILELLYRRDIERIDEVPKKLDINFQKPVTRLDTDNPDEDRDIAQVVREGFRWSGAVLRAQEVVVKRCTEPGASKAGQADSGGPSKATKERETH